MTAALPAREPELTSDTEPFWRGAAEGRLMLLRCDREGHVVWYPRAFCPDCGSPATTWQQAAGTGTVYTFTVTERGLGPWRDVGAYVLAYVELDEGPRVLTNVVDCDAREVRIGMRVGAVFADTGAGTALLRFRPVEADG